MIFSLKILLIIACFITLPISVMADIQIGGEYSETIPEVSYKSSGIGYFVKSSSGSTEVWSRSSGGKKFKIADLDMNFPDKNAIFYLFLRKKRLYVVQNHKLYEFPWKQNAKVKERFFKPEFPKGHTLIGAKMKPWVENKSGRIYWVTSSVLGGSNYRAALWEYKPAIKKYAIVHEIPTVDCETEYDCATPIYKYLRRGSQTYLKNLLKKPIKFGDYWLTQEDSVELAKQDADPPVFTNRGWKLILKTFFKDVYIETSGSYVHQPHGNDSFGVYAGGSYTWSNIKAKKSKKINSSSKVVIRNKNELLFADGVIVNLKNGKIVFKAGTGARFAFWVPN